MRNGILVGILLWLAPFYTANAQSRLQWQFEPGNVYECERVVTQKQSVELLGKTFPTERRSHWVVRLEVIEKNVNSARVQATLTKVEHRTKSANTKDLIDPKLDANMQGSTFRLNVTNAGQITKMAGYEHFLIRLAKDDAKQQKALRAALPEAALREAFADLFGPLPSNAVAKGDRWQREYVEALPNFGAFRGMVDAVLAGTDNGGDRITYTIQSKYEPPKDDKSVLFRIIKGDITSEKATGQMRFDRTAGCLLLHERRMQLRGALSIEVMERAQTMTFASANEMKITIKNVKR